MENRKNKRADINRYRTIFFETGLIIALTFTLAAFEWKTEKKNLKLHGNEQILTIEDMLPITFCEPEHKIPEPPKPALQSGVIDSAQTDNTTPAGQNGRKVPVKMKLPLKVVLQQNCYQYEKQ